MQTKYNLISVIVNCYNGEKFINRCIKSILDQSYQNFEIIFWDNIRIAKKILKWKPKISFNKGINLTIKYYKSELKKN